MGSNTSEDNTYLGEWQEETNTVPQLEFEPQFDQFGNLKGLTHRVVDRGSPSASATSGPSPSNLRA